MKKTRMISVLLVLSLLAGCAFPGQAPKQYSATYLTVFDTVTTIIGTAESESAFQAASQSIFDELEYYHRLFDIYHSYEGLNNLKTINDQAGIAPVSVDPLMISFLMDCKEYYDLTDGKVNIAMGSVLSVWHTYRNDGLEAPQSAQLPPADILNEAAAHTSIDELHIDQEQGTVYLSDPDMSLDVGAVAKGWAAQRAAEHAPSGMLINVGGNTCATGPKDDSGKPWIIGIQNPDGGDYLHTIRLAQGAVITSGDYQRTYRVNGKDYHHIIDPDTLYPSAYWRSVTVYCPDSGLGDVLSTALFVLPLDLGQALADRLGAHAMWVNAQGDIFYSDGFPEIINE